MFEAFKSDKKIEMELRDWLYDILVKVMGQEHAHEERVHVYEELELDELLIKAASYAYDDIRQAKINEQLTGKMPDKIHYLSCVNIHDKANKLAKRKGWRLYKGVDEFGAPVIELLKSPES